MHGYALSSWIGRRSDGVLAVEGAALYQALHRLERRKLVTASWGLSENNRRARYYELSAAGRAELRAESAAWRSYAQAVTRVLQPQ
jgi:DNA-binding PadR family transcriptional regulator